jgi:DNA-binding IclR family transcriptional regulator
VGQSCPAHATSSGKVLLAGMTAADLRARLADPLQSFTANTVVTIDHLERELVTVREQGWASCTEELEVGLNAVSAPVYDASAEVVAALSVSGPSYRMSEGHFEQVAKVTIGAAEVISRRLGWVAHDVR